MTQNILVTGATRGIGAAIAAELQAAGANVLRHGTRGADGVLAADFTQRGAADALWREALAAANGEIDVLVNNAGLFNPAPLDASGEEWAAAWRASLAINLTAPADLCRHAVRHFRERGGGGRIVNIASRAAYRGDAITHSNYAAAKAGLVGLSKTLARGLAGEGILVFTVTPGFVMTGMAEDYLASRGGEKLLAEIPLGRVATPEEVAALVGWLATSAPASMTGSIIDVNGASFMR